jgi:hypothetical protein
MTIPTKTARLILNTALVCFALGLSPSADSQAAPGDARQNQNTQPVPQASTSNSERPKEDWRGQIKEYRDFLPEFGEEYIKYRQDLDNGMEPEKEDLWRLYVLNLRLREDEFQATSTTLFEASQQIKEIEKQFWAANGGKWKMFHLGRSGDEMGSKQVAMYHQQLTVVSEALVKLKQELGKEGFEKLDRYIYRQCYAGMPNLKYPETPRSVSESDSIQPEGNPVPAVQ